MRKSLPAAAFSLVILLTACSPPYERYMQEGQTLSDKQDYAGARKSFHKAVLELRPEKKLQDRLLKALASEKECASLMNDTDAACNLLSETCGLYEKAGDLKKAAMCQKEMGTLFAATDPSKALDYFNAGLDFLKQGRMEVSPEQADLLAAIGDVKTGQKDYKNARPFFEQSCGLLDKIKYSENDQVHATYLHKLAFVYEQLNMENEAIEANQRAKALEMSGLSLNVGKMKKVRDSLKP